MDPRRILDDVRELIAKARSGSVLGINERNRRFIMPMNEVRYRSLADDKVATKELLAEHDVPISRTLAVFTNFLEASNAPIALADVDDCVIKPARGRAGNGIVVLVRRTRRGWIDASGRHWNHGDIGRQISNIVFGNFARGRPDVALVEDRIIQAPLLGADLMPGLPDLRILTVSGEPVMGMLRLPTARSHGKANLHQGAIGVGVDMARGRTVHAVLHGQPIERHPDLGTPLVGRQVPDWSAVLDAARKAAAVLPLGYLGVDLALDIREGPLVIEANVRPGLEIQNANMRGLGSALAQLGPELQEEHDRWMAGVAS